jgi:hypothetical protein
MAIIQISRIQHRRGLQQDLPQLSSAELGWSIDSQRLFIGNGTLLEGAPRQGVTEILTEHSASIINSGITSNVSALQDYVGSLQTQVTALFSGTASTIRVVLANASNGNVVSITSNSTVVDYSLFQGNNQRNGTIKIAWNPSTNTVSSDEEYTEPVSTDIAFTVTANSSSASLNYSTTTATTMLYQISSL